MQFPISPRSSNTARWLAAFVCALLLTTAALAQSSATDQGGYRCSNRSLFGDYGTQAIGVLLPGSVQFQGMSMTHFDGKGGLSWVEHTVIDGSPVHPGWVAATGSYSINQDCTGLVVVNTPFSDVPLTIYVVVVNNGKEVRGALDFSSISIAFIRVN